MKFLEDILDYFDEEVLNDETVVDLDSADYSFLDNGSESDALAIEKIQAEYGLDLQGSEEFLEITQSIQHSLGEGLADQETLTNIDNYIDTFNAEPQKLVGLVNNVKGIYGEHEVIEALKSKLDDGQVAIRDYATNTPDVDLTVFGEDGTIVDKMQVKVTNNHNYILETREALSEDITIVTTDEVIEKIIELKGELPDGIIGVGLSCDEITSSVERTINILSSTEPEFEMVLNDPVISEHMLAGPNPFQMEEQSFGRQVHADKRYNHPVRWVYSGESSNFLVPEGTELFDLEWDPSEFDGVGDPLSEAKFFRPQGSPVSCAIATQRNIIESLTGEALAEGDLIKYASEKGFFDPETGTMSKHLSAILKDKGFECLDYATGDISMIENALKSGDKVMIGVDASEISNPLRSLINGATVEQPDTLHCLQVTGIDYSDPMHVKVILSDPGDIDGAMNAVSMEDFKSAWADSQNRITIVSKNK